LIGGSALSFFVYRALTGGSTGFYASLLPLIALSSFVYLQFRAVFVDVIVRRGAALIVVLACTWFYFNYLGGREGKVTVGGVLFVIFWVAFNGPLARLLDRQLFGRPDHIRLSQKMSLDMVGFVDRDKLIHHVASSLQIALAADWVKFIEHGKAGNDVRDMRMEVAVRTSDQNWGRLAFGPRRFGQTYKRDDLRFLRTVANQLAAILQNFSLHDERQAQARREHELRELATRAELQELRSQINPHFLFNTLSNIADMVRHQPEKAEASILHLARIFRYALNSTRRETVQLGEELDFLTAYLELEYERFDGRLKYHIDVDDQIRKVPIPPMLLQPVVENAVKHGIEMKVDGGNISVSAELHNRMLCVRVVDDGVGFNPGVPQKHHEASQEYRGGMGLANVRNRIAKLSGAENFRISSTIGMGTTVEILLQMA
jgi:two-component sensor histidine kinase